MQYSDLIHLYFDRSNALQWYWTIYVIVIGGLLAFSSLRQRKDTVTAVLVTVLFAFFAYKNLGAIEDVTKERLAIWMRIGEYAIPDDAVDVKGLRERLEPFPRARRTGRGMCLAPGAALQPRPPQSVAEQRRARRSGARARHA